MIKIVPDFLSDDAGTLYHLATETLKEEVFDTVFNPDVRRSQFKLPPSHPLYQAVTGHFKTQRSRGVRTFVIEGHVILVEKSNLKFV